MATNVLSGNQDITLERDKVITITKRTVRFDKTVYQTCNIAAFSEGEVEIGNIPWIPILVVFISGLAFYPVNNFVGGLMAIIALIGIAWNSFKPKHYGLLLILNSGDKKLFVTVDKTGLRQAIFMIYDFIETEKNAFYQISIKNSQVKGNLIQGDVGRNVLFNSNDDDDYSLY